MKHFFILSILLSSFSLHAQTITGVVIDGVTNEPLPGANVFLASTTKGAQTDINGEFTISNLNPVHYQLVVSFVGYKTEVIDVLPDKPLRFRFLLGPAPVTLGEVVVKAKGMTAAERRAAMKIFKDNFIGFSENAKDCKLINPDVLYFEKENAMLTAFADSTLVIENRGLGYRIKLLLQHYEYDLATSALLWYGPMSYELLKPKNKKQQLRWAKNRLEAYYGSEMHFFRSLYKQKLNEEGYFFTMKDKSAPSDSVKKIVTDLYKRGVSMRTISDYSRIVDLTSVPGETILNYEGVLNVVYMHEAEPKLFQEKRGLKVQKSPQSSMIMLKQPAIIQRDGQPLPVNSLQLGGYWSWELVAETLPLDYEPEEDIATTKDR